MPDIILKATPQSPYAAFADTLRRTVPTLAACPEELKSKRPNEHYCLQRLDSSGKVIAQRHAVRVGTRLYTNRPASTATPERAMKITPQDEESCPELEVHYTLREEYCKAFAALCMTHLSLPPLPPTRRLQHILEQYAATTALGKLTGKQGRQLVTAVNTAFGFSHSTEWPQALSEQLILLLPELLSDPQARQMRLQQLTASGAHLRSP